MDKLDKAFLVILALAALNVCGISWYVVLNSEHPPIEKQEKCNETRIFIQGLDDVIHDN
jgi:hypothetical protein